MVEIRERLCNRQRDAQDMGAPRLSFSGPATDPLCVMGAPDHEGALVCTLQNASPVCRAFWSPPRPVVPTLLGTRSAAAALRGERVFGGEIAADVRSRASEASKSSRGTV